MKKMSFLTFVTGLLMLASAFALLYCKGSSTPITPNQAPVAVEFRKYLAKNVILSAYAADDATIDTTTKVLAMNVQYDNSNSILTGATNAQDALDDLSQDYATAIVGTWRGTVACSQNTTSVVPGYFTNTGILIGKAENVTATFTAIENGGDGTYTFSPINGFNPFTAPLLIDLSGKYNIIGNTFFFSFTSPDNSSYINKASLDYLNIAGSDMSYISYSGTANKCVGHFTKQ